MKPTKTVFGALTAAMVIGACGGGMSGLSRTEIGQIANEVETSLDDWHDAAARGDFERYFAHFSDAGMFLGTDATERWSVAEFRDYAREPFSDGEGWVMRSVRRSVRVSSAGDVAWFEE
ncbi:MAG: nuclear transport factor 2 family protein, partial [Myxococcota bacterium]